ncbi:MAG TPA: DUF3572 family protein [Amaricoccus sp.]|nr:DUF3572 family protein [Amaricoccus sp.]
MTREEAAAIGQDALVWLAGQPDALAGFLAASGLAPADLRSRVGDPEFLGFVLEFICGSDRMILDFAAEAGLDPAAPMRARAALPGGADRNWT